MANKFYTKRCSTSLIISETQVETIMRYHLILTRITRTLKNRCHVSMSMKMSCVNEHEDITGENIK